MLDALQGNNRWDREQDKELEREDRRDMEQEKLHTRLALLEKIRYDTQHGRPLERPGETMG